MELQNKMEDNEEFNAIEEITNHKEGEKYDEELKNLIDDFGEKMEQN